jgi:hypothetical protein
VRTAAAAAALVAGGVALGLVAAPRGETAAPAVIAPAGPGFLPAHGWNTLETGLVGSERRAVALAANVPVVDAPAGAAFPGRTIASLPSGGIVVVAKFSWRGVPSSLSPPRVSLRNARRLDRWPGQPRRGIVLFRAETQAAGYDLDVDVYFGAPPSADTFAEAERQLGRLATPPITLDAVGRPGEWELRGRIEGAQTDDEVAIQARECGGSFFRLLFTTHVEPGGIFRGRVVPMIRTDYRAEWKGATSRPVTVQARPIMHLEQESRRRFSVDLIALRYFRHAPIEFRRYAANRSRWVLVKRVRYTEAGPAGTTLHTIYNFLSTLPRGTRVQAVLPRTYSAPCYLAGFSNELRVR